jgi:hypothetical protein
MELKIQMQFDEDKLRELVQQAVENLKAEGYIWKDSPPVLPDTPSGGNNYGILGQQISSSPRQNITEDC